MLEHFSSKALQVLRDILPNVSVNEERTKMNFVLKTSESNTLKPTISNKL